MKAAEQDKPLRIGLATNISNQAIEIAAREAKAQGLDVRLIEFNDWNTPNRAVAEKEIEANLFQHVPFLEDGRSPLPSNRDFHDIIRRINARGFA
ncbi:ABC-type metal ion transport system substrate-binding protein [Bradyrhizobium sp. USDA 4524]|nr:MULTISPECIES: MetQ/NlpA family ABC transporter substrate-binding protein [unclassified Bradyrhizobium]MCP1846050.1 ABC-type metal ion transport system substrate-binding protein [Bradyrhizobium sp. USDA 4538]MCP1985792.1 ABC-type metal ion transport system substrate-binding protein [Bradyrhizobium sp. USDA 4539]